MPACILFFILYCYAFFTIVGAFCFSYQRELFIKGFCKKTGNNCANSLFFCSETSRLSLFISVLILCYSLLFLICFSYNIEKSLCRTAIDNLFPARLCIVSNAAYWPDFILSFSVVRFNFFLRLLTADSNR